jgi:hypothetical protein
MKEEKLKQLQYRRDLEQKQEALEEQKSYKSSLLELTKNDEARFNQYIIERATREQELKEALVAHEASYTRNYLQIAERYNCNVEKNGSGVFVLVDQEDPKCRVLTQYYNAEKALKSEQFDTYGVNPLTWPVVSSRITSYYRDEAYFQEI